MPTSSLIQPLDKKSIKIPASSAQKRLWFLAKLFPGNPFYNLCFEIQLNGELDKNILEKTLNKMVERHDSFKTCFFEQQGNIYQKIQSVTPFTLNNTDLSHLSSSEKKDKFKKQINTFANTEFNLQKGNLIQFQLLTLDLLHHSLLVVLHHIIADGNSLKIFIADLSQIYEEMSLKGRCTLEKPILQYTDFSIWQNQQIKNLQSELLFWQKELFQIPQYLQLPQDFMKPVTPQFRGQSITNHLSKEVVDKIKNICSENNVTLFNFCITAFQILIYRYSRQKQFIIGIPVANRHPNEVENIIGFFMNLLPIPFSNDSKISFAKQLQINKIKIHDALSHQSISFEKIVESVCQSRDYLPLIQVLFVWQKYKLSEFKIANLKGNFILHPIGAKFDLTVEMVENQDQIACCFEFNEDLFKKKTIERMMQHYFNLIDEITAQPQTPISNLNFLEQEEKNYLLYKWNATEQNTSEAKSLAHLFQKRVQETPEKIAMVMDDIEFTYDEINKKANAIALKLQQLPSKAVIAVLLERSIDQMIAIIAVIKAGFTCLPIEPELPQARIEFMLANSNASCVLCHSQFTKKFDSKKIKSIYLDHLDEQAGTTQDNVDINSSDAAYIIFTSGTTGHPKGIKLHHQGICSRIAWFQNTMKLDSNLLHPFSIQFDAAILCLWWPIAVGAAIVLTKTSELSNPDRLSEIILQNQIKTLINIPTMLVNILSKFKKLSPCSITTVISGGEVFSAALLKIVQDLKIKNVFNSYGQVECSIVATQYQMQEFDQAPLPIGKPIANTKIYILDEDLKPTPIGVPGEIYLSGRCVANGYLNDEALTKEKFIPNPYAEGEYATLYKTGDLAKYLDDGNILFLGRKDLQIKISGYRIEPEEIQLYLEKHPKIASAAVTTIFNEQQEKILAAFIVLQNNTDLNELEIKTFLKEYLPNYMIPSQFYYVDNLPLIEQGKINYKALQSLIINPKIIYPKSTKNETEIGLTKIWQKLLPNFNGNINADFFMSGGTSLLALNLLDLIYQEFGIELPLDELFIHPTIKELAAVLDHLQHDETLSPLVALFSQPKLPTIYLIHPVGGNLLCYQSLSKLLKKQFSIYGFHSLEKPTNNIKDIAKIYIQKFNKNPKILLGWSLGGLIAFEMALQLQSLKQELPVVVLLDPKLISSSYLADKKNESFLLLQLLEMIDSSSSPVKLTTPLRWLNKFKLQDSMLHLTKEKNIEKFLYFLPKNAANLLRSKIPSYLNLLKEDILTTKPAHLPIAEITALMKKYYLIDKSAQVSALQKWYEVFRANSHASLDYHPQKYQGRVILFRSDSTIDDEIDAFNWEPYCHQLEVVDLPCNHYELVKNTRILDMIYSKLAFDL